MITRIWLQIAVLLAIAVLPAMLLQLKLQSDGLSLVFDLADKAATRPILDAYLETLKEAAQSAPDRAAAIKTRFREVQAARRALEEFFLAKDSIAGEIQRQTLINTMWALGLSLAASVLVSRLIVGKFRRLLEEQERAAAKLRDVAALENWQTMARSLVHELRAPITPIKLIATDIEAKFEAMPRDPFKAYLSQSQTLVLDQVRAIEGMIGAFTEFGKLPKADPAPVDSAAFVRTFVATYGRAFGDHATLVLGQAPSGPEPVVIDQKLVRDLLFNLCKNAAEANPAANTRITVGLERRGKVAAVTVHNTGTTIPVAMTDRIFEPYVSGHDPSKANTGLGLAIARKIALDHGGDLRLVQNDAVAGVAFRFEFPVAGPETLATKDAR
jgi:signal transduction histidine kinase